MMNIPFCDLYGIVTWLENWKIGGEMELLVLVITLIIFSFGLEMHQLIR